MTEIEVHVSQLRNAAETLHRSGQRIESSVQAASDTIDELLVLGMNAPELQPRYLQVRGQMQYWAGMVKHFAGKLFDAADEIDQAHRGYVFIPAFVRPPELERSLTSNFNANPPPKFVEEREVDVAEARAMGYVSARNRPLYDRFIDYQDGLEDKRTALDELLKTRSERMNDLNALENRLLSYDSTTNLDKVPRITVLTEQIAQMDTQIEVMQGEIEHFEAEIDELALRLDRVQPGANADMAFIASLERGETESWIKDRTEGCVNYIVNKLAVPPGIPLDAHLWDDAATRWTQYGIQMGAEPLPGSVMVLGAEHSYADDVYGHLFYVERIEGDTVWVTDNYHPDEAVRLSDLTGEQTGSNVTFLYFPWHTQA
jgi:hypothetical protein